MSERNDIFGATLAVETLIAHAGSGDRSLRWAAAIELGEIESAESALALWALRSDSDENVRTAAQTALSRFDRQILERALNSSQAREVPEFNSASITDNESESDLETFMPWKVRPLDVPTAENEWAVAAAINDIVTTEGPITGLRLLHLYGQAVHPNAPKKLSKYRIKHALESLFARKILQRSDTVGADELEQWIIHRRGDSPVVVREKGQRAFAEIPVTEVRELIQLKMGFSSNQSADRKFRVVMDAYGIQQRDLHLLGALFEKEWSSLLS